MIGDIALYCLPVVLVAPDLFAVGTDGKNALELPDVFEGAFEFPDAPGQPGLQFDDPRANLHAHAQFVAIVGLGQVIVSAGFNPVYDRARAVVGRQQNNVPRWPAWAHSFAATD